MTIRDAIRLLVEGTGLSFEETRAVFTEIMEGRATDAQIGSFITALRMKGESVDEIAGAASVMREKATAVLPRHTEHLVDTCGTGGDSAGTFNISTAAAFVAAGAGCVVAKHGNRSVSSKSGSADVLEALGVAIAVPPEKMKECLDEVGICFLFAPALHQAMKYAIGPRKEIGIRTVFNILGPLTNPARAQRQLLGVFSPALTDTLALVLMSLGSQVAYVVHGLDPLDEVSITAKTRVSELRNGTVTTTTLSPEDLGFSTASSEMLRSTTPQESAGIIRKVLTGEKGPRRDVVVVNAGFAIAAAGLAATPREGAVRAAESIDSGAALRKLALLVEKTKG